MKEPGFTIKRVSLFDEPKHLCRFDKVIFWPNELGQPHYSLPLSEDGSLQSSGAVNATIGKAGNLHSNEVNFPNSTCESGWDDSSGPKAQKILAEDTDKVGLKLISSSPQYTQGPNEVISSFIRSFFQFARDFDEGEVTRVKFSPVMTRGPMRHARSRTGPTLSGIRRNACPSMEDMYLQCMRGGSRTLIAVFVTYASGANNFQEVVEFLRKVNAAQEEAGEDTDKLDSAITELILLSNGITSAGQGEYSAQSS